MRSWRSIHACSTRVARVVADEAAALADAQRRQREHLHPGRRPIPSGSAPPHSSTTRKRSASAAHSA